MKHFKKSLSIILVFMLVISAFTCLPLTVHAEDEVDTYVVAGTPAEIFGTAWDATNEDNLMALQADGTYAKTYTVDKAYNAVQFKVVKNGSEWIGDATGNNVTFNLTGAGSFTVAIDPDTNDITLTGDIVEMITDFDYDTVYAVGNGEGAWLNGAAWDPAYIDNEMTQVTDDVWEITFENVSDGFERQIKFAIDGAWTHNFGGAMEGEEEEWSGVVQDAVYNGDNITFDTYEDSQTVKVQLDLRDFDFITKEGAKFTITISYDEEPTVEPITEPTTEEPATEPTTEEPATEPTTEEPATEPTTEEPTTDDAIVADDTYLVAGTPADIFGTVWDATNEDNLMTKGADGKFAKTYTVDKAYNAVQFKVVKNGSEWIGDATGNNVTFNLTGAGSFTVAIDPDTNEITLTGDIVEMITDFDYDTVYAVGNGEGAWLNGAAWDPVYIDNEMTQVTDDVWEITFENVSDGFERQIKFAIDGAWTHNFGGALEGEEDEWSGVAQDAVYNGDNISFDTYEDSQTIKVQLDLRDFDFITKEGAKFTITIIYDEEELAPGDVDGDGIVTINDATMTQECLAEFGELNDAQMAAADANGDGKVSIKDVTHIQRYLAEFVDWIGAQG